LGNIFSEAKVWSVICELPTDRAPVPDGFVGAFYHRTWNIIKNDIMAVVLKLYVGDGRDFGRLNRDIITLIPKKPDAKIANEFRPIRLVHSFAKIFSKFLANRMRP
jgi:hypothetical protein